MSQAPVLNGRGNPLAVAFELASRGIPVFPVRPANKAPLTPSGFHDATTNVDQIAKWWAQYPGAMIGVPTGRRSGLLVIDVDRKNGKDGLVVLSELESRFGKLPSTRTVRTPSGGLHLLFEMPDCEIRSSAGHLGPGIDHRGDGGFIVWASSVTDAGLIYEVIDDRPLASPPTWLVDKLNERRRKPVVTEGSIDEGIRNDTLFALGMSLRRMGIVPARIRAALLGANEKATGTPLPDAEVLRTAESVASYGPHYTLTQTGLAERLRDTHGREIRYSSKDGWMIWDGKRWTLDDTGRVTERAKFIGKMLLEEAHAMPSEGDDSRKQRNRIIGFAHKALDAPERMLERAKSDPALVVRTEEWDRDKYVLNAQNGVLDLRTGQLLAHDPSRLISKITATAYDPEAKAPIWAQFLTQIMNGDHEMIGYLARLFGMALTGDTSEHVLAILYGVGKNGKSTFAGAIEGVLGDYAAVARQETLMVRRNQGIPTEIADMKGARFILASEPPEGARLDAALVKELTGGERIKARHLYQRSFTFQPEALFALQTNFKPTIQGADSALARRLHLIRFGVVIPDAERDRALPQKLKEEYPGILAWLVRGCLEWQRDGLRPPATIVAETESYRSDMDLLGQFIEEMCDLVPQCETQSSELYSRYAGFLTLRGERVPSQKSFTALAERRLERIKRSAGMMFRGVRLKSVH